MYVLALTLLILYYDYLNDDYNMISILTSNLRVIHDPVFTAISFAGQSSQIVVI